jgi:hypothetical protein
MGDWDGASESVTAQCGGEHERAQSNERATEAARRKRGEFATKRARVRAIDVNQVGGRRPPR